MNELRQEFEAHEEIAQAISDNEVYYDEDAECYIATAEEFIFDSGYLNGAWWAYQEQHKKYNKSATANDKIEEIFMVNSNELHNNR